MSEFKKRMESYRRHPGSFLLFLLVMLSALTTFVVLLFLIAYILIKGVPNLKPSLFAWKYTTDNASMLPVHINTLIMTVMSPGADRGTFWNLFRYLSDGVCQKRK